jgi:3-dehydroquinate dehydratase-1
MRRDIAIGTVRLGDRPAVVAAGGETDVDALATEVADLLELRADLFDEPSVSHVLDAVARLRATGRPIVFTVRAASEGGRAMPEARRAELYRAALPHVDAIDVEIASLALVTELVPVARAAGRTVVLSAHDFVVTPSRATLLALVEAARTLGADLPKVATHTTTLEDLHTLIDVTRTAAAGGIVTLGMGALGPLSRIVLPAAGSLLTYGAAGGGTAPGQTPVAELAALVGRLFP